MSSSSSSTAITSSTGAKAPKKRKNSFFSRLSSFRFSLKNSKKEHKEKQQQLPQHQPPIIPHKAQLPQQITNNNNKENNQRNSFVHIPLKDPIDKLDHFSKQKAAIQRQLQHNEQMFLQAERDHHQHDNNNLRKLPPPPPQRNSSSSANNNNSSFQATQPLSPPPAPSSNGMGLHKKPPLPKHPPRVIGVCAKRCADAQQARDNNNNHHPPRQSQSSGASSSSEDAPDLRFASHNPRRAGGGAAVMPLGRPPVAPTGSFSKIGLIETNLDTHETVISGKTRSLMELHPAHHQRPPRYSQFVAHRVAGRGRGGGGVDEVSGVEVTTMRQSLPSGPVEGAGMRQRPHKSMEFLLDKENQLFTLVS